MQGYDNAQSSIQKPNEEIVRQLYSDFLTAKAEKLVGRKEGQCVVAVRNFLGVGRDEVAGLAKNTKINSQTPALGAIIVLKLSAPGHVGVVLDYDDNTVIYYDSNGDWTQRGAIRERPIIDPKIRGYRITGL